MKQAIELGLIGVGDSVIAVQGWTGGLGHSNTLRVIFLSYRPDFRFFEQLLSSGPTGSNGKPFVDFFLSSI